MDVKKTVEKYTALYEHALVNGGFPGAGKRVAAYARRLTEMYGSEAFARHNVYPTMDVAHVYAVIAMCLELRERGMADADIMAFVDEVFAGRRRFFARLVKGIDVLPNSFAIVRRWNINDHAKRVADGSITYDTFEVTDDKVEYRISHCMYVEMFAEYGIRSLCKIFCKTDVEAYARLTRHVRFIRHSDLSDGPACHDEIMKK